MRELCLSSYAHRVIVKTCVTRELDDHHSAVNVAGPFYVSLRLRNPLRKSIFIKDTSPTFADRHSQARVLFDRKSRDHFSLAKTFNTLKKFLVEETYFAMEHRLRFVYNTVKNETGLYTCLYTIIAES